jgi:hypothetical protein
MAVAARTRGPVVSWYNFVVLDRETGDLYYLHSSDDVIAMLNITRGALKWHLYGKQSRRGPKYRRTWRRWKVRRIHMPCWRHPPTFWRIRRVLRAKYHRALRDLVATTAGTKK